EGDLKDALRAATEPAVAFFQAVEAEFLPAIRAGDGKAQDIVRNKLLPLFRKHRAKTRLAVAIAQRNVANGEAEAEEAVAQGRLRTLVLAGIVMLLVFGSAVLLLSSVTRSMHSLVSRMKTMALTEADLGTRITIDSKDEVGELSRWINRFLDKIAELVLSVKKSSIQLTSTATELAATSREQESTMNAFGASTNQIAAAVQEISGTGRELAATMDEVKGVASESAHLATSGGQSLRDMVARMGCLSESSQTISSRLAAIHEKANEINAVVTTITKVADQTNLLSVNAAIESEKAGEYGRGFLVVAREIRRLADQTASASLDIEETVTQMQGAVSAGVMEMDKFADEVHQGVDTMGEVSGQLGQILEQVALMSDRFDLVAEGMASQAQGALQINDAMGSLSSSVQQTISSLHEFTSAADDLKRAVDGMKTQIGRFRLEG
ncbi:MAG: methyl-accepting chemotaxis protein, partial [Planctomycetota bacterium]